MDMPDGHIRAERLDIEFNQSSVTPNEPQRVKLYNVATFAQKIQMWLIVAISFFFLLTNLISFASFFHWLPTLNPTCQCPPRL